MLHTSITIGIGTPDELPEVHLNSPDSPIPLIEFSRGGEHWQRSMIALHFDGAADQVAWLREVAHRLTSLAEVIEAANVEQVSA